MHSGMNGCRIQVNVFPNEAVSVRTLYMSVNAFRFDLIWVDLREIGS